MKKCPSYAFPYYGGKATHLEFILPHLPRSGVRHVVDGCLAPVTSSARAGPPPP